MCFSIAFMLSRHPCIPTAGLAISVAVLVAERDEHVDVHDIYPRASPCNNHTDWRIAIIGAGVAGLAAAQSLRRAGCKAVVFEASDVIGGRASRQFLRGNFAGRSLGARWIHAGADNVPLAVLSKFFNIHQQRVGGDASFEGPREALQVLYKGETLPRAVKDRAFDMFFDIQESLSEQAQQMVWRSNDVPAALVWEYARERWNYSAAELELLHWQNRVFFEQQLAADARDVSARFRYLAFSNNMYPKDYATSDAAGDSVFVGGFGALVERMSEGVDVRLRTTVHSVDSSDASVLVRTSNGNFNVAAVIVTVSLGLLQAGDLRFEPPLPPDKLEALNHFAMGQVTMIFVMFSEGAFPIASGTYLVSRADFDDDGESILSYCLVDKPVLECFASGGAAAVAQSFIARGQDALHSRVVSELRDLFPALPTKAVQSVEAFPWSSDPLTRGAWAYARVGSSSSDIDALSSPHGRVHFAGEAVCRLLHSAVEGAIVSGARAAYRLLPEDRRGKASENLWPLFDERIRSLCDERIRNATPMKCEANVIRRPLAKKYDYSHGYKADVSDSLRPLCADTAGRVEGGISTFVPKHIRVILHSVVSVSQRWTSLDAHTKILWETLGWSQRIWDSGIWQPPVVKCAWNDLGDVAMRAAWQLGFSEELWPIEASMWHRLCICRIVPSECQHWDQMDLVAQSVWQDLGWNRARWDEGVAIPTSANSSWHSLGDVQKQRLAALGHHQGLWEGHLYEHRFPKLLYCNVPTIALDWQDLPASTKSAWSELGWSKENWDVEAATPPDVAATPWWTLSSEMREVAKRLGYIDIVWDAEDEM